MPPNPWYNNNMEGGKEKNSGSFTRQTGKGHALPQALGSGLPYPELLLELTSQPSVHL